MRTHRNSRLVFFSRCVHPRKMFLACAYVKPLIWQDDSPGYRLKMNNRDWFHRVRIEKNWQAQRLAIHRISFDIGCLLEIIHGSMKSAGAPENQCSRKSKKNLRHQARPIRDQLNKCGVNRRQDHKEVHGPDATGSIAVPTMCGSKLRTNTAIAIPSRTARIM